MIDREEVRGLLLERKLFAAVSDDLDDDSPVVLDSMSLIWFLHGLNERHGLELTLEECDLSRMTSVRGIHEWLVECMGSRAEERSDAG